MMIGIGIAILTISLFVFLLIDCLRRIEAEFPTLVYDGKTISQRVIKRTWTWFLILSFALGLSTSQTIWGHSTTDSNFQSSGVVVTKYQYLSPFFIYKVETAEGGAKGKIHQVYRAATKQQALEAFDDFMALYEEKYPKACACLRKDKEVLFTFYDFPAAHWKHLRTTNPIESTFATVRHRTRQTKGCGSRQATLTMVYKLGREAEKHWRRLDGSRLMVKVLRGVRFIDGEERADDRLAA